MANYVQFKSCTQAKYNALTTKESNALYFTSDTFRLYRGENLIAGDIKSFATLPTASADLNGLLVYAQDTGIISECVSGAWVSKFLPFEDSITDSSEKVPTSHAVLAMASGALGVDPLAMPSGTLLEQRDDGQWVIRAEYNPGIDIKFNDRDVTIGATAINFAGTVKKTVQADGTVKIQIGDNMNSSVYNSANDGVTNATVTDNIGTNTAYIDGGTSTKNVTKTQNISITPVYTSGYVHLSDGTNTWKVTVYEGSTEVAVTTFTDTIEIDYEAEITGGGTTGLTVTYGTAVDSGTILGAISSTHSTYAVEDNYPKAVGARGTRSFTVDMSKIGARKATKIVVEGIGGSYTSKVFYYITGSNPTIGTSTLITDSTSTKTVDGVNYYTTGTTFQLTTGTITNLNNQAQLNGNRVTFSATNCTAPSNVGTASSPSELVGVDRTAQDNECYYTKSGIAVAANKNATSADVTTTVKNYYNSTGVSAKATCNVLINTYSGDSTAAIEYFKSQNYRLAADATGTAGTSTNWMNDTVLKDDALQTVPGVGLIYPQTNYSSSVPAGPDYSACTGMRYFSRKFISGSGTKFGGTLTIAGLGAYSTNDNIELLLSIDNGTTWYNLKTDRGGADPLGIRTSYTQSSGAIAFTFPGTTSMTATDGVLVKIGFNASLKSALTLTQVTLTM